MPHCLFIPPLFACGLRLSADLLQLLSSLDNNALVSWFYCNSVGDFVSFAWHFCSFLIDPDTSVPHVTYSIVGQSVSPAIVLIFLRKLVISLVLFWVVVELPACPATSLRPMPLQFVPLFYWFLCIASKPQFAEAQIYGSFNYI